MMYTLISVYNNQPWCLKVSSNLAIINETLVKRIAESYSIDDNSTESEVIEAMERVGKVMSDIDRCRTKDINMDHLSDCELFFIFSKEPKCPKKY